MRRVLLTGFEPFGGEPINPSRLATRALDGEVIFGVTVVARELPCVFGASLEALDELLDELSPELVIAVGQAGDRGAVSLERVAINLDDAPIPDNRGRRPIDRPIDPAGPPAFFTTLPVKAMAHAIDRAHIPVELSQSAGAFVCNHVFYGLMQRAEARGFRAGFVHVPLLPEQLARAKNEGAPALPLEAQIPALRIALEVALGAPVSRASSRTPA